MQAYQTLKLMETERFVLHSAPKCDHMVRITGVPGCPTDISGQECGLHRLVLAMC
jgi:hypothetical protein